MEILSGSTAVGWEEKRPVKMAIQGQTCRLQKERDTVTGLRMKSATLLILLLGVTVVCMLGCDRHPFSQTQRLYHEHGEQQAGHEDAGHPEKDKAESDSHGGHSAEKTPRPKTQEPRKVGI